MSEPSTDSETPDSDATQCIQFEGRTVCVIAPEDLEALEKQRNALSRDLAARDAITAERIAVVVSEYNDEHSRACKLAARVKELEAERDKQKIRGDNHAETLRGIAAMDDDPARMRLWARDSLSGQFETFEATILRLCDERNALTAERDALDDAKQKMWVRLNAAENAKQAGDKMIARLMEERDELLKKGGDAKCAAHVEKPLEATSLAQSTDSKQASDAAQSSNPTDAATIVLLTSEVEQLRKDKARMIEALESIAEYWNGDANDRAMLDACEYASSLAARTLSAMSQGEE